jgi:4-amino-4-deoxy-L-arabinose transferase-like glycosyltransferase
MLLPLSYVYSYMVAGEVDEYLARIVVAALGAGTLAATYALGRALYDTRTGLAAALLLALMPTFTRWASSGYTDIPAAFFVTLAVLFAWWVYKHGGAREGFLLGVMAGLAAWTKNSALALSVSLALWLFFSLFSLKLSLRSLRSLRLIAIAAFGLAITAGPWYARNLIVFGRVLPDTVWTERAEHTAENFVPFVLHFDEFFLPGIIITAGIALVIVEALRRTSDGRDQAVLLLVAVIPFAAAWWWAASYETRFLLAVLPLFAVMGGRLIAQGARIIERVRPVLPIPLQLGLVIVLVALAIPAARKAVIFKYDLLRDPLMGDTRRHQVAVGPIYDAARDLNALPAQGRILSDNYFLPFYVNDAGRVEVVVGGVPRREMLAQYDYLVYSGSRRPPRFVEAGDVELLIERQEYRVYRVLYPRLED